MLRRVILPLGIAVTAACSLAVDLDGLTGGGAKDAGPEASLDASGGPLDGSPDAPGAPLDAGADVRFCAAKEAGAVHFCADFDDGPLAIGWSDQSLAPGTMTLDDASWVSPPYSARFEMDAGAPGCSYTTLFKEGFANVSSIHAETAVFLDPDDAGPFDGTLFLVGKHACVLYVDTKPGGLSVHEQEVLPDGGELDTTHDTAVGAPSHRWSVVAIDADFASRTFTLRLDGQPVLDKEPLDPSAAGPGSPFLQLGFACNEGLPYVRNARYDNVLLDGK